MPSIPLIALAVYVVMSVITFLAYGSDKRRAQAGAPRISESLLLALGLFGGWPGGLVAQQVWRHKTRKASFQATFWVSVVSNLLIFGGIWFILS